MIPAIVIGGLWAAHHTPSVPRAPGRKVASVALPPPPCYVHQPCYEYRVGHPVETLPYADMMHMC